MTTTTETPTKQWTPVAPINDLIGYAYAQKEREQEAVKAKQSRLQENAKQALVAAFGDLWESVLPFVEWLDADKQGQSNLLAAVRVSIPELLPFDARVIVQNPHQTSLYLVGKQRGDFSVLLSGATASYDVQVAMQQGYLIAADPDAPFVELAVSPDDSGPSFTVLSSDLASLACADLFYRQILAFESESARKVKQQQREADQEAKSRERRERLAEQDRAEAAEAKMYLADYAVFLRTYSAAVSHNRGLLGEAWHEASQPFPAWSLTHAVVGADEDGDRILDQGCVLALNDLDVSNFYQVALPRRIAEVCYKHVVSIERLGEKQWADYPSVARLIKVPEAHKTFWFRPDDAVQAKMAGLIAVAREGFLPLPDLPVRPRHANYVSESDVAETVRGEISGESFFPYDGE